MVQFEKLGRDLKGSKEGSWKLNRDWERKREKIIARIL